MVQLQPPYLPLGCRVNAYLYIYFQYLITFTLLKSHFLYSPPPSLASAAHPIVLPMAHVAHCNSLGGGCCLTITSSHSVRLRLLLLLLLLLCPH